jgi:hypothetical protein
MIIGICGKKQAGKNTVSNILHGLTLLDQSMISDFNIDANGKLWIETKDAKDNVGWGEFDVTRTDEDFVGWAEQNMYPYIKNYSFADPLKVICHSLFGLTKEQCWGTDEQKNTPTALRWENMPGVVTPEHEGNIQSKWNAERLSILLHESGPMTARELLQFFGTNVMRKMYAPVWVNATVNKIKQEGSLRSIISDVRFPDEADAIKKAGGKLIKLTRSVSKDTHASETALDNYTNFDYVIDNSGDSTVENLIEEIKKVYRAV